MDLIIESAYVVKQRVQFLEAQHNGVFKSVSEIIKRM